MDSQARIGGSSEHAVPGLFFDIQECKCLFRKLKAMESKLGDEDLFILNRIEKMLYSYLTIKEIKELAE